MSSYFISLNCKENDIIYYGIGDGRLVEVCSTRIDNEQYRWENVTVIQKGSVVAAWCLTPRHLTATSFRL